MPDYGATPQELEQFGNGLNLWQSLMLLENNIYFVKPEKDFTLDSILSKVAELKKRGIKLGGQK